MLNVFLLVSNCFKHFFKICQHKCCVGKYCFKTGLYWRGLTHDLSKFSPTEFFESIKYYNGKRSPIELCKEKNGYYYQNNSKKNTHSNTLFFLNI